MDGFVKFIDYFVRECMVPVDRLEGKLEYLIETLEKMTNVPVDINSLVDTLPAANVLATLQPPEISSARDTDPTPDVEVIDADLDVIPVLCKKYQKAAKPCPGYILPVPDGCSPRSFYPFLLHDKQNIPWDYSVVNGKMILHARACEKSSPAVEDSKPCHSCNVLKGNMIIHGILERMKTGVHRNARCAYHGFSSYSELLDAKNVQIDYLRLRGLNQA
ncbi:hypothetical protein C0991_001477 [Blastosporella zonata]|nr:hypothetical protein C0991_001477 [Blastosporella zonata]